MESFIRNYFDNKTGENLKLTITPKWTKETLEDHLKLLDIPKEAIRIYEIGSGFGRLLKELAQMGKKCYGCDASVSMVNEALNYAPDVCIELCEGSGEIPQPNESFDFVFSLITFQHIPHTETVKKYLSEAYRILYVGGNVMFQVLATDLKKGFLWSYHKPSELIKHMEREGFKNIRQSIKGRWMIIRAER
jgi:ubiquinone/menaquinone biosynthesis C-methylase UbiE